MEKNKKKILFVISGIAYSGAEKVLEDYVDNTNEIECYYGFYFAGDAYNHFKEKYSNVFLFGLKYNKLLLALIPFIYFNKTYKKLNYYKKKFDIDNVFFNNTLEGLLGYNYIKKNKNSVFEIHDMRETFAFFFKRYLISRTIMACEKTITVSNACKKSWNDSIRYVVYNGMNFKNRKIENEDKKNTVVYIGNSSKRKGYDICLEVAKHFEDDSIEFIMIFGDIVPQAIYPKNAKVFCKLEREKIFQILEKSKVLFLPSRNDPFPTVILEGQLYNNIIVANNVDGVSEMVPNPTFLATNNDIDHYINAIKDAINMDIKEFNKFTSNQYEYIKKFDINIKVATMNKILLGEFYDNKNI